MSSHHDHKKDYLKVWIALLILTGVTVWTAGINFGKWNIYIAMAIAILKASLVCLFFMHLKYDNKLDKVTFISSLVFFAIFVALTLSDLLFRNDPTSFAKVSAVEAAGGSVDLSTLIKPNAELIELGKKTYANNCTGCHGPNGDGNGAAAASLNPKPRDFTSNNYSTWKIGPSPAQIVRTLNEGIPGSAMGAQSMSVKEKWALAHYIRTLSSNPPGDTPETLAKVGYKEGTQAAPQQQQVEIPIDFAIKRMLDEAGKK